MFWDIDSPGGLFCGPKTKPPSNPGGKARPDCGREGYFIYGKMRSSLGAAGKRARSLPPGAALEQGTKNQGVGANKGPGLLRARKQIGKVLRKIRIFSDPRGETCRKIKRDRGNPPGLSQGMVAGVGGHGFRGTFPPTPLYSGVFSPA